jgi:hypothetical protein
MKRHAFSSADARAFRAQRNVRALSYALIGSITTAIILSGAVAAGLRLQATVLAIAAALR